MFSNLANLVVQKAQQFIDPALFGSSQVVPSKSHLFQAQFRLPDDQNPLTEIAAEFAVPIEPSLQQSQNHTADFISGKGHTVNIYHGKLYLSEKYLCFSTQQSSFVPSASHSASSVFAGQTYGTGPSGNGFTLPLAAVRRVERVKTSDFLFTLAITTANGFNPRSTSASKPAPQKLTVSLDAIPQHCEAFCDALKRCLKMAYKDVNSLSRVVATCYSEFLLSDPRSETDGVGNNAAICDTGLGMIFQYPGNARLLRDKAKMRLWQDYLLENGRNSTLIRQPTFHKLIRVGLPNRLRGEIWELTSGGFYSRVRSPKIYQKTLSENAGKRSPAIDDIEKDLNRSLPEYPGFQDPEGIERLRRVLTAYSWSNPGVGYCQAMNIVVAALLIYCSEEQAFHILSVLCDKLVPGYYSTTMYGTLLDQKVFESLVEKTMPVLWKHMLKLDVQLSVVSLPWFLSLFINSMPLISAFRVLDVFFLEGPKVLFQIALAIFRINGEELLDISDDGTLISVLKQYFLRLDESAHPDSDNPKLRAITKFQELMVTAFNEFSGITHNVITEQREKFKDTVLENIETFAKRTSLRNLGPSSKKLPQAELEFLYDRFYTVLYDRAQRLEMIAQEKERNRKAARASTLFPQSHVDHEPMMGRVGLGPSSTSMDYDSFREFLAGIAQWAVADENTHHDPDRADYAGHAGSVRSVRGRNPVKLSPWGLGPEPAEHDFISQLFSHWDKEQKGSLSFQNVVTGMAQLKGSKDIMANIAYFFDLYDLDHDGKVDREGILRMSEALLFLGRKGVGHLLPDPISPTGMPDFGVATVMISRKKGRPPIHANSSSLTLSTDEPAAENGSSGDQGSRSRDLLSLDTSTRTSSSTTTGRSIAKKPSTSFGFEHIQPPSANVDEMFLSSVSSFIRRCFEYADPEKVAKSPQTEANQEATPSSLGGKGSGGPAKSYTEELATALGGLSVGQGENDSEGAADRDRDTGTHKSKTGQPKPASSSTDRKSPQPTPSPPDAVTPEERERARRRARQSANAALDPDNPLFLTLPTFRMLILADEVLERFFEWGFSNAIHLGPPEHGWTTWPGAGAGAGLSPLAHVPPHSATGTFGGSYFDRNSSTATIGAGRSASAQYPFTSSGAAGVGGGGRVGGPGTGVGAGGTGDLIYPAAGKGLRGMIDSLVADGLKVAAEVKKRMDEAQRDLDQDVHSLSSSASHVLVGPGRDDDGLGEPHGRRARRSGNAKGSRPSGDLGHDLDHDLDAGGDLLEGAETSVVTSGTGRDGRGSGSGSGGVDVRTDRESPSRERGGDGTGGPRTGTRRPPTDSGSKGPGRTEKSEVLF